MHYNSRLISSSSSNCLRFHLGFLVWNSFDPSGAFVCEGTDPGGTYKLRGWRRLQRMSRSASRLTGQNVRGLASLKLAKVCKFMKDNFMSSSHFREGWKYYTSFSHALPIYDFDLRASPTRTLLPAALTSVSFGFVLVRVRVFNPL